MSQIEIKWEELTPDEQYDIIIDSIDTYKARLQERKMQRQNEMTMVWLEKQNRLASSSVYTEHDQLMFYNAAKNLRGKI